MEAFRIKIEEVIEYVLAKRTHPKAHYLEHLEAICNDMEDIKQVFDMIIGTSVGTVTNNEQSGGTHCPVVVIYLSCAPYAHLA